MDNGEAVREFEEFFSQEMYKQVSAAVQKGEESVIVDFMEMDKFNPELSRFLREQPDSAIEAAKEGIQGVDIVDAEFKVRFGNLPEEEFVKLKNLRSEHIGKFVPIEGMIKRASQVKPEVVSAIFECVQCGDRYEKEQEDTKLKSPYKCDCGSRKFEVEEKIMTDTQVVTVEENPENREGSEQPSSLSVRLEGDLVDPEFQQKVVPGNVAHITGIIRERPLKKNSKKYDIFMDANNLEPTQQEFEKLELSEEEEEEIRGLAEDEDIFKKIASSIAPSIYGHEKVKEAIALQLFSGVKKTREDGVKSRGDLHILLIGEPGTGKSQLLKFTGELAPKGRYAVGKSSTGAGLTASVVKEESTGEFSLEAGAVVLAHKGMCAIDEIDKMSTEDRSSLHEAMEQQCFAPDTEVQLADGHLKTIEELVKPRIESEEDRSDRDRGAVVELDETIEVISSKIEGENETGEVTVAGRREAPEKIIRIELSNGRTLEITPEHPFYGLEDGEIVEKEARKLDDSSFVLAPRKLPIKGEEQDLEDIQVEQRRKEVRTPEHNSAALATFTGYQISDGGYEMNRGEKNGFNFSNTNRDLVEDYMETVSELFEVEPYLRERENRESVRVISMELKEWLEKLGPLLEEGTEKKIPERLMKCRRDDLRHLLRAFFDGDGGVYRTQRGYRIRAVTENRELMQQMQSLLLRFGITSVLRKEPNVYRIDISRKEDLRKFREEIGFLSEKKSKRLEEALDDQRSTRDPIPGVSGKLMDLMRDLGISTEVLTTNLCRDQTVSRQRVKKVLSLCENQISKIEDKNLEGSVEELRETRDFFDISMREIAEKIDVSPSLIGHWEKNGTERDEEYRKALEKCLENRKQLQKEIDRIRDIAENHNFLRVREVSTDEPDYDYVYDLTVPGNRNFVAEGAIVHNSISVSKANIQATLNAETAILAAGNPKLGRFDPYEPIPQQIEIGDTLLSRFDFIFPVKDEPDEERDMELSSKVLQNHIEPEETQGELSQRQLRKYVAYAKRNVRPELTQEAADKIQEFYVGMRSSGSGEAGDSVPVTARQLEALVRVSEASARAELRDKVTEKDAQRSIDILQYCLEQVGVDPETGDYDIDMIESGVSGSQRNRLQTLKHIINDLGGEDSPVDTQEVISRADKQGIPPEKSEEIINKLKSEGELFEPKQGSIQRI